MPGQASCGTCVGSVARLSEPGEKRPASNGVTRGGCLWTLASCRCHEPSLAQGGHHLKPASRCALARRARRTRVMALRRRGCRKKAAEARRTAAPAWDTGYSACQFRWRSRAHETQENKAIPHLRKPNYRTRPPANGDRRQVRRREYPFQLQSQPKKWASQLRRRKRPKPFARNVQQLHGTGRFDTATMC